MFKVREFINSFVDENAQIYISKITKPNKYSWFKNRNCIDENYMDQYVKTIDVDKFNCIWIDLVKKENIQVVSYKAKKELKNFLDNNIFQLLVEVGENAYNVDYGKLDEHEIDKIIMKVDEIIKND